MKYALVLLLVSFVSVGARANPDSLRPKNLVFEGGGVRGIAYAGALAALEKRGVLQSVEQVGGTSVGAITALLVALGYTADEMTAILGELKIQQFNDGRWFFIGGLHRMTRRYGWYRGERFERWVEGLIVRKTGETNLTFAQLHGRRATGLRDLFVTGTNLTAQKAVVFSHRTTPDMPIKTAVRISMSVPLYFGAVFMDEQNHFVRKPQKGHLYQVFVDGGLTANYPLALFDTNGQPNPETLGLKLERPEQIQAFKTGNAIAPYPIQNINEYVSAFYNYAIESLNRPANLASERDRTIYISMEHIRPRVRRMRPAETQRLYESGQRAAQLFRP